MTIDLGHYGFWRRLADTSIELAQEAERLGYGAIWLGGSPPGDLEKVEAVVTSTERAPVATGIVNMWRVDPKTVAESFHRIEQGHPGRLVLGLGIGHPESVEGYRDPYDIIGDYLDEVTAAGVTKDRVILAALGPRVLTLAAERTLGAHPYLTTPRHTRIAREVMGEGPLLAPEQKVVPIADATRAREIGRANIARYLRLVNYRNNLLREGWAEEDLAYGGSDELVDKLILHGDLEHIAAGIQAHLDAGADHVGIQVLGEDPFRGHRELAEVLFG